jgi:hypothetical protein
VAVALIGRERKRKDAKPWTEMNGKSSGGEREFTKSKH